LIKAYSYSDEKKGKEGKKSEQDNLSASIEKDRNGGSKTLHQTRALDSSSSNESFDLLTFTDQKQFAM
jgi:hypothetical protein